MTTLLDGLKSALEHYTVPVEAPWKGNFPTAYGKITLDRRRTNGTHQLHITITLGENSSLAGKIIVVQDDAGNVCGSEVLRVSDRNPLVFWAVVYDLPHDRELVSDILSQE